MNDKVVKEATAVSRISLLVRAAQVALSAFVLLIMAVILAVALYLVRGAPAPVLPDESVMTFNAYEGYGATAVHELSISQRPLFWQERRLHVEEDVVEVKPVKEKNRNIDKFRLIGLFNAGTNSSAVVMYKDTKHRLRIDDELDGWTLVAVEDNAALFRSAGFPEAESKELYKPVVFPQQWPASDSLLNDQSDF